MAKPNEQTYGQWSRSPIPSNFWMIAVGAKAETFTWWIQSLKFGFRLHSPGFWGKRVNLMRNERGLQYLYIIILVCMSDGRGVKGDLGLTEFEI